MTEPGNDWGAIERTWRSVSGGGPGGPGHDPLAGPRRRLVLIGVMELAVAGALTALGVTAVVEHHGVAVWILAGLLVIQGLFIVWIGRWARSAIERAAVRSTKEFLVDWRRLCQRQLRLVRVAAALAGLEGIGLAVWVGSNVPPGGRILPAEVWWFLGLVAVLLGGAWLAWQRGRVLQQLSLIVEAEGELGSG